MKKKVAWLCLLLSPLVLGGAAFCFSGRDPITQANCDRIKQGMTIEEVEVILGRKWDDVKCATLEWKGVRGEIGVLMSIRSSPRRVVHASFWPSEPKSLIEKIRNWLGM